MGRRGRGRVARKRQEEDKPDTDNDRECSPPSSSTNVDDVPETQVEVTKSQLESTDEAPTAFHQLQTSGHQWNNSF